MIVDALLVVLAASFLTAAYRRGLAWTLTAAVLSAGLILIDTWLCLAISRAATNLGLIAERNAGYETLFIICFIPTCALVAMTWASKWCTPRRSARHQPPTPQHTLMLQGRGHSNHSTRRLADLPSKLAGAFTAIPTAVALLVIASTITSHTLQGTLSASPVQSHVLNWGHHIAPHPFRSATTALFPAAPAIGPPAPVVAFRSGNTAAGPAYTVSPDLVELISQYRSSIVKVTANAPKCGSALSASGFVIAPGRVLTNAHAVAAVTRIFVQPGGSGPRYKSRVIHFDPASDLAVLQVPHLKAAALPLAKAAAAGDQAVVVGYPRGGKMTISPGRISRKQHLWSTNIVTKRETLRRAMVLDADVKPGNSGGPVLDEKGHVSAIVFARDRNHDQVAFASDVHQWRSLRTAPEDENIGHENAPCPQHIGRSS